MYEADRFWVPRVSCAHCAIAHKCRPLQPMHLLRVHQLVTLQSIINYDHSLRRSQQHARTSTAQPSQSKPGPRLAMVAGALAATSSATALRMASASSLREAQRTVCAARKQWRGPGALMGPWKARGALHVLLLDAPADCHGRSTAVAMVSPIFVYVRVGCLRSSALRACMFLCVRG